jgi:hypothetical protein
MTSPELAGLRPVHCIGKVNRLLETAAMAEEGRWHMLLLKQPAAFLFGYPPERRTVGAHPPG